MGLKDAYSYMNREHILTFYDNHDIDNLKKTIDKLSYHDRKIQYYDLIQKLENDRIKYGDDEIVWIYFKEDHDILIPYRYRIPKYERFRFKEPSIETLLKNALEVFTLAIK